jgi:hypothetical protein
MITGPGGDTWEGMGAGGYTGVWAFLGSTILSE